MVWEFSSRRRSASASRSSSSGPASARGASTPKLLLSSPPRGASAGGETVSGAPVSSVSSCSSGAESVGAASSLADVSDSSVSSVAEMGRVRDWSIQKAAKKIDKILPKEIISIHRTNNVQELAEIYTSADVFVNLTKEDNFPTVNIEALACGTPIITYNTGGSPEIIDKSCGVVVQKNDIKTIANEIIAMCEKEINVSEQCRKRAVCFKKENMISSYLKLYSEIGEN